MVKAIFRLPEELHKALKLEAVKRGVPMQELAEAAIRDMLAGARSAGRGAASVRKSSREELTREESELISGVLAFLRGAKDPARALGVKVIRAVIGEKRGAPER